MQRHVAEVVTQQNVVQGVGEFLLAWSCVVVVVVRLLTLWVMSVNFDTLVDALLDIVLERGTANIKLLSVVLRQASLRYFFLCSGDRKPSRRKTSSWKQGNRREGHLLNR